MRLVGWILERRNARIAAIVWGLFLLALTSWPSPPEIPGVTSIPNFDKFCHTVLYGVEGFLLYFAIRWPERPRSAFLVACFIGGALAVFGTLDELHQAWIPGRSMEGMDAVADATAGFLGGLAGALYGRRSGAFAGPPPVGSGS
jgi:VanZ family protein